MKINHLAFLFKRRFSHPVLLFILAIISYGLMIPWLRFFHDEYPIIWFHSFMGDVNLFYEGNRPLLSWFYKPLLAVFTDKAWLWQCFGVLSRWLHATIFYYLIREIWPKEFVLAVTASTIILIFPAFQTQFASMIYGIAFLLYSLFFLSILFSILAIRSEKNRVVFSSIAMLLSLINLLTNEYFYTLELIRYLVFLVIFRQREPKVDFGSLVKTSLPYLSILGAVSIFRFYNQPQITTYPMVLFERLSENPIQLLPELFKDQLVDIWNIAIRSWIIAVNPIHLLDEQSTRLQILFLLIAILSSLLIACTFIINYLKTNEEANPWEFLLTGFSAMYLAGWPLWIAGLPVGEFFSYSRWSIPFMMGASIFTAGLLRALIRQKVIQIVIISILVGIGVRNQLLISNSFRHDWQQQQQFFWQIKWRMPSLQENTVLFSDMLPFKYENSDQLSAGINMILSDPIHAKKLSYFMFYIPERINTSILPEIRKNLPVQGKRNYRSFQGNTSQAILIDFQHPACLHVLNPLIDEHNPLISPIIKDSLFLSDEQWILNESGTSTNINIFGKEPVHEWCYYFQKADLARQFEKWDDINQIYQEVKGSGFQPRDNREWMPFIEGMIHLGNYDEAFSISKMITDQSGDYKEMVCQIWKHAIPPGTKYDLAQQLKSRFDCRL